MLRSLLSGALRSRTGAGSSGYRSTGSTGAGGLGSLLGGRSGGRTTGSPAGGGLGSLLGSLARRR